VNTLKLLELEPPLYFTEDVYIDKKFLLFTKGSSLTEDLKRLLSEWQLTLLYTQGETSKTNPVKQQKATENESEKGKDPATDKAEPEKKLSGETVEKIYNEFSIFAAEMYDGYRANQLLDTEKILNKVKEFCSFVQENRQSVLILQAIIPYNTTDFLVTHSVRSTVFAIVLGMELKLQNHQLADLAAAALMHEIGLIHIAEDIYTKTEKLSDEEKKYLYIHPVLSCKILKKAKFPLPICLGTLDHHERENGTGYPQKLFGEKISLYGKIIAVVCSYEAITGERKYKTAEEPSAGLLNILRRSPSQYDEEVLRALLNSLSFFPIGSFVHLSNNIIAQVIDTNADDPRFPIVRDVREIGKYTDGNIPDPIHTGMDGIRILRPASREEWMAEFSKEKKK